MIAEQICILTAFSIVPQNFLILDLEPQKFYEKYGVYEYNVKVSEKQTFRAK